MSSAVYTHSQLVKQGVDAELHVWEGMFHGFFYNPDVPELREAYNVMVKFFDHHLGQIETWRSEMSRHGQCPAAASTERWARRTLLTGVAGLVAAAAAAPAATGRVRPPDKALAIGRATTR